MKKIYVTLALLIGANCFHAQLVDFESVNLAANSYDNGSSENGNFIFNDVQFYNTYDPTYFSWNGFSMSNVQDNVTAGWGNQYASFTNGGMNSSNYAVFYSNGEIIFDQLVLVDSFFVTNTTYAALSMRDGDQFSKQFGSVNGPDGNPDGTNGEDYYLVKIITLDANDLGIDTLDFYLADYRFSDNAQDYIVNDWRKINLTSIQSGIKKIKFELSSSDNGQWGMNTPAYFALDNLSYKSYNPLSLADQKQDFIKAYPNPFQDAIQLTGVFDQITVYNEMGQTVLFSKDQIHLINTSTWSTGIYTLKVENQGHIKYLKLVK